MNARNSRRQFLRTTAAATTAVAAANLLPGTLAGKDGTLGVALLLNTEDARNYPAQWAVGELREALKGRGVAAEIFADLQQAPSGYECVVAVTGSSSVGKQALAATGI